MSSKIFFHWRFLKLTWPQVQILKQEKNNKNAPDIPVGANITIIIIVPKIRTYVNNLFHECQ